MEPVRNAGAETVPQAIARAPDGRVQAGSGAALAETSTRRLGTGQSSQIRRHIEPHREAILDNLIALAKAGKDAAAVRAASELLDRLAAKPKAQAELVLVPGLADADTLQGKCDAVICAVAGGQVSADAGRAVLQMLHVYGRAKSIDALEARMRELERQLGLAKPAPVRDAEIIEPADLPDEELV